VIYYISTVISLRVSILYLTTDCDFQVLSSSTENILLLLCCCTVHKNCVNILLLFRALEVYVIYFLQLTKFNLERELITRTGNIYEITIPKRRFHHDKRSLRYAFSFIRETCQIGRNHTTHTHKYVPIYYLNIYIVLSTTAAIVPR